MFRVSFNFDTLLAQAGPVMPPVMPRNAPQPRRLKSPSSDRLTREEMCRMFFPDAAAKGECDKCGANCAM